MSENNSGFKVDESQRQNWLSIAAVWAGGMICVPCLMIGGVLAGGGLSMGEIIASILIGYGLICAYMICIGMQACDTGLPVSVMASGALGEKGARYIISTLLAIACVGWFGIQSATCGSAFASMLASMMGTEASPLFVSISSIVWGVIMLVTACVGFKGLKWLNYIAVPLLVIVCLYGLIAGITANDGGSAIANYAPEVSSGLVRHLHGRCLLCPRRRHLRRLLPLCQEPRRRGQVLHRRRHPRRSLHAHDRRADEHRHGPV